MKKKAVLIIKTSAYEEITKELEDILDNFQVVKLGDLEFEIWSCGFDEENEDEN